jgi:hypothetical protein
VAEEKIYYRVDSLPFPLGDRTVVMMREYPVIRETRCGLTKWVKRGGKKRWAYPTREQAVESFRARKKRLIEICKWRIEEAEQALAAAIIDQEEARLGK